VHPHHVLSEPALGELIDRAADPGLARSVLERLLDEHPTVADELRGDATVRAAVVALACASRSLTTSIIQDPALLGSLRGGLDAERGIHDYDTAVTGVGDADALRRWKRYQYVRIAARDLLGFADLPAVGRELAALAQACLGGALRIAEPELPLAVIGMGKLGGVELNYASDVDVLFVHEGEGPDAAEQAEQAARRVLSVMAEPTEAGIVFRTDADLRPEGKAGALSRNLDAYRVWWERWARTWEYQALLKARPVAGDAALGTQFLDAASPFVWPEVLGPDVVREIRAGKARAEAETHRLGLTERELKRGRGGIRDIEFAVQLLQLVHGRHDAGVRSPNTLQALGQLAAAGYVAARDAVQFDTAYRFLRTAEHRLQLWDERQTHTLPGDTAAHTRLARVLGFRDRGGESAGAQLATQHRAHQAHVRRVHEKLFFEPLLDAIAGGAGPLSPEAAQERMRAFGFTNLRAARGAFTELTQGLTRTSRLMEQLLPVLLEWCSASPDPDLALLQLRRLAEGPARSATLAVTLRESPLSAERACTLLGSSRMLGDALRRQPEYVTTLGDDTRLAEDKDRTRFVEEALATVEWRAADEDARRSGLRRFKRRELLRIGARDVLGAADLGVTGRELATLGEACLEAALDGLDPQVRFAVIGMGRFGGADLSYASDLDVVFVHEGNGAPAFAEAERVASRLLREIGEPTAEGRTFAIDPDLRPEGRQGVLTRSLDAYVEYWQRWGLTWELQAMIKARPVAGDYDLGARLCAAARQFVYRASFDDEAVRDVRRMKLRIEQGRIRPGDDPDFHLKLGRGSLSDVEFTVQLLQLTHGAHHEALRTPVTMTALDALVALDLLEDADAAALRDAYGFCSAARNARFLVTGSERESLPSDPWEAERVARLLGYVHRPQAGLRDDYRRITRRCRKVVNSVFYGKEPQS